MQLQVSRGGLALAASSAMDEPPARRRSARSLDRRIAVSAPRAARRILVCIDRSADAETCLRYALELATTLDAELSVLHVIASGRDEADAASLELSRQEARAYLAGLVRAVARPFGPHLETWLEHGHAAERIVGVAREIEPDVTVLGSVGLHGAHTWSAGSTVLEALVGLPGSVLLARRTTGPVSGAWPRRILVPLDGSARAEGVLAMTARIAEAHRAEVLLATVVPEPVVGRLLCVADDVALAHTLAARLVTRGVAYLDEVRERLVGQGLTVCTAVLRSSDEREALLRLARSEGSDLVVLSAHGANCNLAVLRGSVTEALVARAEMPLLVLQDALGALHHTNDRGHRAGDSTRGE